MSVVPQQFEDGLDGLDLLGLSAHLTGQHQKLLPQPVVALAPLLLDQTRDVFNLTQAELRSCPSDDVENVVHHVRVWRVLQAPHSGQLLKVESEPQSKFGH